MSPFQKWPPGLISLGQAIYRVLIKELICKVSEFKTKNWKRGNNLKIAKNLIVVYIILYLQVLYTLWKPRGRKIGHIFGIPKFGGRIFYKISLYSNFNPKMSHVTNIHMIQITVVILASLNCEYLLIEKHEILLGLL